MIWEAWFTIGVISLCFFLLLFTRWPADITFMGGLTLLLLAGVLTPEQALAGLANEGMVTVGVLFVISAGLQETGAIQWIANTLLGQPRSIRGAQWRVMAPVAAMSAFLNNTPVVAMMIPAIHDWAKKHQLSVSKLMIPLSYAAIIGGTCTLIGTSTNLVVNGLVKSNTELSDGLSMFEIAWVGLPCVAVVLVYVLFTSRFLLPDRRPVMNQFSDARQYTVEMMVEAESPLVGKMVEEAGLRSLPGMYLIEIDREGQSIPAVSRYERLHANDRLIFAGVVESVVDLQKIRGLTPATDQLFKLDAPRPERRLIEAVVSDSCPLLGKTIREGRFRTIYNAAVIAVARNGEQVKRKLGDIVLRQGDTLLLEAHPSFMEQHRNSRDFFLISLLEDSAPLRHDRAPIALAILGAMVIVAAMGLLTMLQAVLLAAGLMIVSRCISGSMARRAVDWQVLIVIAASFGIGQALQVTGAAAVVAEQMIMLASGSPWVGLVLVYFVTALFSALITNNAAAVLMFPVALSIAEGLGVNFMPFIIAIMMAASTSFATPIGYQTNLMVFGPGGYHFVDYLRIGGPLTLLVGAVTVFLTPWIWPFYL